MGYCETSDAEMIALTRAHRVEERFFAEQRRFWCRKVHERLKFPFTQQNTQDQIEAAWRENDSRYGAYSVTSRWKGEQWASGVRNCGYCWIRMTRTPNSPRTCTVDHRKPRALGGKDVPENFILACLVCNGRKGLMSEAQFRQHLATWKALAQRLTG